MRHTRSRFIDQTEWNAEIECHKEACDGLSRSMDKVAERRAPDLSGEVSVMQRRTVIQDLLVSRTASARWICLNVLRALIPSFRNVKTMSPPPTH